MAKTTSWLLLLALSVCLGCTQPDNARRILENAGYTRIEMHGYSWFGCSRDDVFADTFTAIGPTGKHLSGVVCAGIFYKTVTIRMN